MGKNGLARGKLGIGGWLLRLMPARTRRVIALTSVYTMLYGKEPNSTQLTQLNNAFALASDIAALRAPSRAPELFWGKACCDTLTRIQDRDAQQTFILQHLPAWMVYSNVLDVANDIRELLHFTDTRSQARVLVPDNPESIRVVATA